MALSVSIIFCNIIAAASANIRLERCHFCGHPFVLPDLLTLDDGAEAGLFKEPSVDPVWQGLTEIVLPGCSGRASVMVDHLSCLCLLLASYRTVSYVQNGGCIRDIIYLRYDTFLVHNNQSIINAIYTASFAVQ